MPFPCPVIRSNVLSRLAVVLLAVVASAHTSVALAQPNPFVAAPVWAKFPDGRSMGAVGDTDVDPDGVHVWAIIRCDASAPSRFGDECVDSDLDSVFKFDPEGNVAESFGSGMFIWPHGIDVDEHGNVWVTDAAASGRIPSGDSRGHQVVKFSPSGEVLMILGVPGRAGSGNNEFDSPSDVVISNNGSIFVADGHGERGNNRVVKFSADGTFLKAWGKTGYAPGEFRSLHTIAIDLRGRVFVGDRSNSRIQLFDQEGVFLAQWTQFGRPSGIFFDAHDNIYVADSESDDVQNPGWEMGIRIGDAHLGWVHYFIRLPNGDPRSIAGNGAEFVSVDAAGNIYAGEPRPRNLQKYVRVRR